MSTPLPLAGELADDLLYGADAIGAYLFRREDAQRARRAVHHLVSEPFRKPDTDFRLGAVILPPRCCAGSPSVRVGQHEPAARRAVPPTETSERSVLRGAERRRCRVPGCRIANNMISARCRPFSGGPADHTQCSERLLISARSCASLRSIRRIIAKKRLR